MTIESVTYISDLDATYPAEGEVGTLHEGNNHIRNIKTALKTTLPNFSSAMSASAGVLNKLIGLTATAGDLNVLQGAAAAGVTRTSIAGLAGLTATAGALNIISDVTVTGAQLNSPVLMTAQASTSGTSIDFTSIPAWAKRITVLFSGVSSNGTSGIEVRIGDSGGIEDSGYVSSACGAAGTLDSSVAGISTFFASAAGVLHGAITLWLMDAATNLWAASGTFSSGANNAAYTAGSKALSAALDRVSVVTVNGTDAFDAGTINVMYE
jgi:hypothetical protein